MMRSTVKGAGSVRWVAVIVAVGFSLIFGATVHAEPQYELDCTSCHNMPPSDSPTARKIPTTGAVPGNHQAHAGSTPLSCAICHGGQVLGYDTSHSNGIIALRTGIGYSRNATGFLNQTSLPPVPLGGCSTASCHSDGKGAVRNTPAWGSAPFAAPGDCSACHDVAPATGNHPVTGAKHAAYFGTGTNACVNCHSDHTVQPKPFAHATSAGSRGIDVHFARGGSFANGTCSGVYCHSDGNGGAPLTTPVWGGSLPGDCTGCHGGNATSSAIIATGSHGRHVNNANLVSGTNTGSVFACARCHNITVSGDDRTLGPNGLTYHVNGSKDVSFSDGGTYSGQSCSGTLCHSAGKASAPQPAAPAWGGAALSCTGCHGANGGTGGVTSQYGEPSYPNAGPGADLANSHSSKHLASGAASCANCHAATTADGVSIINGTTTHANGSIDVSFAGKYDLGGAAYSGFAAGKNCSATYCHSDGNGGAPLVTPQWGGTTTCVSCHGGDAATSSPMASFKHRSHMNNYSTLGRGNNLACGQCHAKTVGVADNATIVNPANHVNLFKDYSGTMAGGSAGYVSRVCSNVYCHSSGQAAPVFRIMTGSKAWDGNAKFGCNGCHGYGPGTFTSVAGEPNYPSAVGTENSHYKHTVGAGMTDSTGCATCHRTTVDAKIPNKLRDYSSAHLNGKRDISFAVLANFTGHYTAGTKSCANTYCHSSGAPVWGTAGPLPCSSCHNASNVLPAGHGKHWETTTVATSYTATPGNSSTASSYQFQCSSCHGSNSLGTSVHADGPKGASGAAAEVFFGYTGSGRRGSYSYGATVAYDGSLKYTTNGSCQATYCHSDGNGGNPNIDYAGFNWSSSGVLGCTGCHGGNAASGTVIGSGLHRLHVDPSYNPSLGAGNGLACASCHAKTVDSDTHIANKANHVNRFKDYSGALAYGPSHYDGSNTKSCTNIYCHSNGNPGATVYTSQSWSGTPTAACNGCHGTTNPTTGAPDYSNGYPGNVNTANSHSKHVAQFIAQGAANDTRLCANCHVKTVDAGQASKLRNYSTVHLNGTTNVAMKSAYLGTGGGFSNNVCSNVTCHSNGKGTYANPTWGQTDDCNFCHPFGQLSRGHIFHIYTSWKNLTVTPAAYQNLTSNRSGNNYADGKQRYNFGCANCHPITNTSGHTVGQVLIDFRPLAGSGTLRSKNSAAITAGAVVVGTASSGTTVPQAGQVKCLNIYCHSNGMSGSSFKAYTTPDWYAGSFTGDRCANCHGNSPNTGNNGGPVKPGSAAHTSHVVALHNSTIASSGSGEIAPAGAVGTVAGHGDPTQATTFNCNVCHYATVTSNANDNGSACSSCHGATKQYGAVAHGAASIANKALHVNGTPDVSFQSVAVRSKAQVRESSFTNTTSVSNYWSRNQTGGTDNYKNGTAAYDVAKYALANSMFSKSGSLRSCSNIACHNARPVDWNNDVGKGAKCTLCHTNL